MEEKTIVEEAVAVYSDKLSGKMVKCGQITQDRVVNENRVITKDMWPNKHIYVNKY